MNEIEQNSIKFETVEDFARGAKVYTNGAAVWFCQGRKWKLARLNSAGKPYDWSWRRFKNRAEVEEVAGHFVRQEARERAEFPAAYSDWNGQTYVSCFNGARPARTPYFYRTQAIAWAREARRPFGILGKDGGAARLAKSYLKSYRESLAAWHTRYGV